MKKIITLILLITITFSYGQNTDNDSIKKNISKEKSKFWNKVSFGGGVNLNFGNTTVIGISPEAIYQVNDKFSFGAGAGYQYVKNRYVDYSYNLFSVSAIGLFNPFYRAQLSTKIEENFLTSSGNQSENRNVTALYLGVGYSPSPSLTMGVQYDVLYDVNKSIYNSPFSPFIRVYF